MAFLLDEDSINDLEDIIGAQARDRSPSPQPPHTSNSNRNSDVEEDDDDKNDDEASRSSVRLQPRRRPVRHIVHLRGVAIEFPYEPYPCQIDYMACVLDALDGSCNAALESPTGTGKTMCLLCASCAWLMQRKERYRTLVSSYQEEMDALLELRDQNCASAKKEKGIDSGSTNPFDPTSEMQIRAKIDHFTNELKSLSSRRVIFTSRTHSQLKQVIAQFKKTSYYKSLNMVVLGSKFHMCINSRCEGLQASEVNTLCSVLRRPKKDSKETRCVFSDRVKSWTPPDPLPAMDIDDLKEFGLSEGMCPYVLSHKLLENADLVFCPYQYIIGPAPDELKKSSATVIVDEAHNLPDVCVDAATMSIKLKQDLEQAQMDVHHAIAAKQHMVSSGHAFGGDGVNEMGTNLEQLRDMIMRVSRAVASEALSQHPTLERHAYIGERPECVYDLIRAKGVNVTVDTAPVYMEQIEHAVVCLTDAAEARRTATPTMRGLTKLKEFLGFLFVEVPNANSKKCKKRDFTLRKMSRNTDECNSTLSDRSDSCSSTPVEPSSSQQHRSATVAAFTYAIQDMGDDPALFERNAGFSSIVNERELSLWCLDARIGMDMITSSVVNVIVTSGTLSPFESYIAELGTDFPVRLQNRHVVPPENVTGFILSHHLTPEGLQRMSSQYNLRDHPGFRQGVPNTIVAVARRVPDGMIVFFPSYVLMTSMITEWRREGSYWGELQKMKKLFIELRSAKDNIQVVKDYVKAVDDGHSSIMFAVCRGKISEGIDFPDRHARCVIIVGIPFSSMVDLHVVKRKDFIDKAYDADVLTGTMWYQQQALRSVNQALGRIIRHRNDYGAVVLCDSRFLQFISSVSAWLREHITHSHDLHSVLNSLDVFFRAMQCPQTNPSTSAGSEQPSNGVKLEDGGLAKFRPPRRIGSAVSSASSSDLSQQSTLSQFGFKSAPPSPAKPKPRRKTSSPSFEQQPTLSRFGFRSASQMSKVENGTDGVQKRSREE